MVFKLLRLNFVLHIHVENLTTAADCGVLSGDITKYIPPPEALEKFFIKEILNKKFDKSTATRPPTFESRPPNAGRSKQSAPPDHQPPAADLSFFESKQSFWDFIPARASQSDPYMIYPSIESFNFLF